MTPSHYLAKAGQANANALRLLHRKRNWRRAKYWSRQTLHYLELHVTRYLKLPIPTPTNNPVLILD